jgi:Homeodomain-like domain
MADLFSQRYGDLLTGSYDCVDRIVLNAYYPLGHNPGGFRVWWRRWHDDSVQDLDNAHLMRLADRHRPGQRRTFPATAEAEVKALACALPAETDAPLARWSAAELAAEAVDRGLVEAISPSTVARWLAADAIRARRHRSWIFPRDPDFAVKGRPGARPLRPDLGRSTAEQRRVRALR